MRLIEQFIRFAGVGAIGTAAHYSVLIAGAQGLGMNPVLAASLGFVVGAVVNYALNYRYTFQSRQRHRDAAPKFFTVAAGGMALNAAIVWLLLPFTHYLLAQAVATGVVLGVNFLINRWWTFQAEQI